MNSLYFKFIEDSIPNNLMGFDPNFGVRFYSTRSVVKKEKYVHLQTSPCMY